MKQIIHKHSQLVAIVVSGIIWLVLNEVRYQFIHWANQEFITLIVNIAWFAASFAWFIFMLRPVSAFIKKHTAP